MSEGGIFQPNPGLRGWRPALPLVRSLELRKRDLEARALFEDIGDAVSALVRSNGKTRVGPAAVAPCETPARCSRRKNWNFSGLVCGLGSELESDP